jgi:GrpB-like predicted nucleotidyltransferase (UPF0157 family)
VRLVRETEIRPQVTAAFARLELELGSLLPGARIEHVGSTAVPGSLTKGDLDVCAIVPAAEFAAATTRLEGALTVHQSDNWTAALASFIAPPEGEIEIGVQLVVAGSAEEAWFVDWRERLRADPDLRERYDRLKVEHGDGPVDAYRAAKERLILAGLDGRPS